MIRWEVTLRSLSTQVLGRPVYLSEDEVVEMIKIRDKGVQDAYVSLWVSEELLQERFQKLGLTDSLGRKVYSLGSVQVSPERVEFVHANAMRYRVVKGRLVLNVER